MHNQYFMRSRFISTYIRLFLLCSHEIDTIRIILVIYVEIENICNMRINNIIRNNDCIFFPLYWSSRIVKRLIEQTILSLAVAVYNHISYIEKTIIIAYDTYIYIVLSFKGFWRRLLDHTNLNIIIIEHEKTLFY